MTFQQGMSDPCVFVGCSKVLLYFVHGDDYFGFGVRCDLDGDRAKWSERFIIKGRGVLGADGLREICILNRVITSDPRMPGCLEMLCTKRIRGTLTCSWLHNVLTTSSKTKATLRDKAAFLARHPLAGPLLNEERRVASRSNCMMCQYLALDRPDIQFTAKEISRAMASPTTPMKLSRLFRGTWLAILACCGDTLGKNGVERSGVDRLELGRSHWRPSSCREDILFAW